MRGKDEVVVLVVDDDELVRRSLEKSLRRLGYEVLLAEGGEVAMRVALDATPDVILLDLRMPGLDGRTLLRRLPAAGVEASIVVMSAIGEVDDVVDALRCGAVDYLRKPWTTNDLLSALARAVQVSEYLDEARLAGELGSALPRDLASATVRAVGRGQSSSNSARPGHGAFNSVASVGLELSEGISTTALLRRCPEEAPVGVVARLVEDGPPLAAALLRLANGPLYARGDQAVDIRSAVARVGSRQVRILAEALDLADSFQARLSDLRALQRRVWRFSVARGLAMRAISDVTGPEVALDSDTCHLAGVVLDVGAVSFLGTEAGALVSRSPGIAPDAVSSAIREGHALLSEALLREWDFPPPIVALAGEHHLDVVPIEASALWYASVAASSMAERLVGFPDPTSPWRVLPELVDRCTYALGVGETVLRKLAQGLAGDMRAFCAACAVDD